MRSHVKAYLGAACVVAAVVVMLLVVLPALAASAPPRFSNVEVQELHATRANVKAALALLEGEYEQRVELATSESGPWTVVYDTTGRGEVGTTLTHLTPETTYYVRFIARNSNGVASEILKLKTPAVEAPEIARITVPDPMVEEDSYVPERGPTYVAFQAVEKEIHGSGAGIESNGADTTYHFEYALPEAGHAPSESSGSWAPFTTGASGTISVAEESANPEAKLTGLTPETKYYVRLKAENGVGAPVVLVEPFETTPAAPSVSTPDPMSNETSATTASVNATFQTRGSQSEYRFEYTTEPGNSGSWDVVPGGTGTIPAVAPTELFSSERFFQATATLAGLRPATSYYVRIHVENEPEAGVHKQAISSASEAIETDGPPVVSTFATHSVDGEVLRALGSVVPGGAPVDELQRVTLGGGVTGGTFTLTFEGQTTGASATGTTTNGSKEVTGFTATVGTVVQGEQVSGAGIPAEARITEIRSDGDIVLSQAATATNIATVLTVEIPFDASGGVLERALGALSSIDKPNVMVVGNPGGPYTVQFAGSKAGVEQPQLTAGGSGLVPSGSGVSVSTLQTGAAFSVHYHAEYVSQEQFEKPGGEGGFAGATAGPEVSGSGLVGVDMPGLQPGLTYHYRVAAVSEVAPHGVVGNEQTVTVPVPGPEAEQSCSNKQYRTGLSAVLPDCRAYEQVTPVEKEGAEDIFAYGLEGESWLVGEDGDHFMLHVPGVNWGSSPDSEIANYFFARNPETGWHMTSTRPEHETSPDSYRPFLFDSDLTQVGVEVDWETTSNSSSPDVELETGPPGGPYTPIGVPIPRADLENASAWAGGSADGNTAILQTEDHKLLGHATGTTSGKDLYEFSEGVLRQVNVTAGGGKISSCGAKLVKGHEGYEGDHGEWGDGDVSSPNAVSEDGSRVFFYDNCTHDLYVRTDGTETTDIGEYQFLGADDTGSELLLERDNSGTYEIFLYKTEKMEKTFLMSMHTSTLSLLNDGFGGKFIVSTEKEKLNAFYMTSSEQLTPEAPSTTEGYQGTSEKNIYYYNISTKKLQFVVQEEGVSGAGGGSGYSVSPDGRYLYWTSEGVVGVLGGRAGGGKGQVYRYDSIEGLVQCMSCASPYDPQPSQGSLFVDRSNLNPANGLPNLTIASDNGDYVFFDTTAALVPQDIDGEVKPEGAITGVLYPSGTYSSSSDVYEWRKNGVDGCSHVQGCLALISSGTGGLEVELLGTDASGSNVFFASHEPLVYEDQGSAGNVYDARIGGGFPSAPPGPVECEADECSTPVSAPVDTTPASFTFSGVGNVVSSPAAKPVAVKKKKLKAKKKTKKKKAGKAVKRRGKAKKSSRGTGSSKGGK